MQLYNTLSAEERAQLIDEAGKQRLTLSFYAYAKIEDPKKFRDDLFIEWNKLDALGRTYVAKEGIKAQMSVPAENFEAFRETLEAYIKRLEQLESIADSFDGVEKSFAMQAGRDLRVIVKPEEMDELTSIKVARDIKDRIENEMQYPGTIRITVIRETRAVEEAR